MSTYNIPGISSSDLASSLSNSGIPFTISPNGSGSSITTSDDSGLTSLLGSSGIGYSSSNGAGGANDPFLSALEGQTADTPSATTFGGEPQQSDAISGNGSAFGNFLSQYGSDAAAIVIGLIIIAVSVAKLA